MKNLKKPHIIILLAIAAVAIIVLAVQLMGNTRVGEESIGTTATSGQDSQTFDSE